MPYDTRTNYPGIIIRMGSANDSVMFPSLVNEALNKIASQPVGRNLLNKIGVYATGEKKIIITRPPGLAYSTADCKWSASNKAIRFNDENARTLGKGTSSGIFFNPNIIATPDGSRPSFIGLAHELIHAYYNLKGKAIYGENEEYATVGIAPGPKRSITENKIRQEHGIPARATYQM